MLKNILKWKSTNKAIKKNNYFSKHLKYNRFIIYIALLFYLKDVYSDFVYCCICLINNFILDFLFKTRDTVYLICCAFTYSWHRPINVEESKFTASCLHNRRLIVFKLNPWSRLFKNSSFRFLFFIVFDFVILILVFNTFSCQTYCNRFLKTCLRV